MAILFQSRPNSHDFEEESTAEHTGVLQAAIQEGKIQLKHKALYLI